MQDPYSHDDRRLDEFIDRLIWWAFLLFLAALFGGAFGD